MGAITSTPSLNLPVIIGTAGHIDHGKSSLIRALTGTDPDRLKEEKERGITIDLGFAFLNERVAFIDVPGHENFIKNMVAGAATVDYALFVIAADDGVMPQTREHLDILNLLDIRGGVVAITKADIADDVLLEVVREDASNLFVGTVLEGAPIHVVDSLSGRGIEDLRRSLLEMAEGKRVGGGQGAFRMPLDRVFTMKGFGTVVTGSVLSGMAGVDDRLTLLPAGVEVRVRGVQSQSRSVERVVAGQRAALNLGGMSVEDLRRGDILATPGTLEPTQRMIVKVTMLKSAPAPIKDRQRFHLHIGTADLVARAALLEDAPIPPCGTGYVELRLESPTAARRLDRFILRQFSPVTTVGGGVVLDPLPSGGRRNRANLRKMAERLSANDEGGLCVAALDKEPFATVEALSAILTKPIAEVSVEVEDLKAEGAVITIPGAPASGLLSAGRVGSVCESALVELSVFHEKNPLKPGMLRTEMVSRISRLLPKGGAAPFVDYCVGQGLLAGPAPGLVASPTFAVALSGRQSSAVTTLNGALTAGGMEPPSVEDLARLVEMSVTDTRIMLTYLVDMGRAVCLERVLYFSMDSIENARKQLTRIFDRQPEATLADIRSAVGGTRKFLIPVMQYFETIRWTIRNGDVRCEGPSLRQGTGVDDVLE